MTKYVTWQEPDTLYVDFNSDGTDQDFEQLCGELSDGYAAHTGKYNVLVDLTNYRGGTANSKCRSIVATTIKSRQHQRNFAIIFGVNMAVKMALQVIFTLAHREDILIVSTREDAFNILQNKKTA